MSNKVINIGMNIDFEQQMNGFLKNSNTKNFKPDNMPIPVISNTEYIESFRKNFKSMYVLDFVQDEDIFEFFKSLIEMKFEDESSEKKIASKKNMCKYIHMIIRNPVNKTESYELGLKVIDIAQIKSK